MVFSPKHSMDAVGLRYHADMALDPAVLAAAIDDARRQWPGVEVAPDAFAAWVDARQAPDTPLASLRLGDLYLACACAAGNSKALAAFEAAYLAPDTRTSDDLKQALRDKLFVATAKGPPRIALYAGRGDLGRWTKATLTRMEIDAARAAREVPTEDALLEAIGIDPAHDPEVAQLRKDAKAVLQAAMREAFAALADRERAMLLQYYVDSVGVVELGKLYGLAPSNISRTIAKTRVQLVAQIRRALLRSHQIHGDELDSLVGLVGSQLSLTGHLREK
jgi:RNA polymerase sigma-70 factor (ECF subfamily)